MKQITIPEFLKKVDNGLIFTATFKKRSTGEVRIINCRTKVKKHVKGVGANYSFSEKRLLNVYDLQKKGYRNINLDGLQKVRFGGSEFKIIK